MGAQTSGRIGGMQVVQRPAEIVLMSRVARRFYLDGKSKSEIADETGVSRFRVARLLEAARRDGIVRIEIESPGGIDAELTEALQRAYGLPHAIVMNLPDDDPALLRRALGRVLGDMLREVLTAQDVLGLAWARSLEGVADKLPRLPPSPVVQLSGALLGPDGSDVIGLVRRVAKAGGGVPHVFYAPLVAADAASARMVRRQPEVARAFELAERVTVAVVGIGAWQATLSTIYDSLEPPVRDRARALGAIGEISGALIDTHGREVRSPLRRRIIGLTVEHLGRIDTVLSVAYGKGKAEVVAAALRSGLVNGLVTHAALARELIALAAASDAAPDDRHARQ